MMGTTGGSLGYKNWGTSFSESLSLFEALTGWKVVHRVQEPTGFSQWTYRLHNLNSTTFLLPCKTCLEISKDTREYNSFCAWAPPLLDRKAPLFTFYQSVLSDSIEWLVAARACMQNLMQHWSLVAREERKSSFPFPATCSWIYAVLRQHQLSSCPRAAYFSWWYGFKTCPHLVWQYIPSTL